jgi:hypothetical protein
LIYLPENISEKDRVFDIHVGVNDEAQKPSVTQWFSGSDWKLTFTGG